MLQVICFRNRLPQKRPLTITPPDAYDDNKWKNKTRMIDLDENKVPVVEGFITGKKGIKIKSWLTIDTGDDEYLVLGKTFVMRNVLAKDTFKLQANRSQQGLGGLTSLKAAAVSALSFHSFTIKKPTALFSFDKEGFYPTFDGGLPGRKLFRSYQLILNYPKEYLVLYE